ncbi:hypothetical protein OB919_05935 [Halobacteria archaeon AArc-curdl1]|uniref:Uncharacterized protein n=1 Tax=Natronosalvus hydrolyticus TaxID=2979988 RepID=A0AAP2Z6J5_9EURY|nr:hypothetical protein [Halobacteria archaeon AArc-curdl1]
MRRRHFIAGLGTATALTGPALGRPPNRKNGGDPVENVDTGDTYDAIQPAVNEAEEGHTIEVALENLFQETVTIETDSLTLRAEADSRARMFTGADTVAVKESGNSSREIDGDSDNLVLTTTGNAQPTVTGAFETVFVESRGNSQPEVEGEIEQLYVDARGNAAPNIEGDVDKLTVVTKGNARVGGVSSASEYTEVPEFNSQPVLDGSVEIRASSVAVEGLDIDTDTVGIDIGQGYAETIGLSNNVVSGTDELVIEAGDVAAEGAGVQVRTAPETEEVSLGGAETGNLFVGNYVGILVLDDDGELADIDTGPIREKNRFYDNKLAVAPSSQRPDEDLNLDVSDDIPVEVVSSKLDDEGAIIADLPSVPIDEDESKRMLSLSVRRKSAGTVEFALDPEVTFDDPDLPDAYEPIGGGGFEIDTDLEEDEIEVVRFSFSVDRDELEDPHDLALQRQVNGTFEQVRTVLVSETPTSYQYVAFTSGFSLFQLAEFDEGGVGGAGRELEGTIILPDPVALPDGSVEETFLRIEASKGIDTLDIESTDSKVTIDDEITIDLSEESADDLPVNFASLFEITNAGSESVTVRTTAGLSNVDFFNVPEGILAELLELDPLRPLALLTGLHEVVLEVRSDQTQLNAGQRVSSGLSVDSTAPDDQFWFQMLLPTLVEGSGEAYDPTKINNTVDSYNGLPNTCKNGEFPVLYPKEYGYNDSRFWSWVPGIGDGVPDWIPDGLDDDTRVFRIPATLSAHWQSESATSGRVTVIVDAEPGPEGELVALYDKNGIIYDEGELITLPIAWFYSEDDFSDGSVDEEFDLVFTSETDCEPSWGAVNLQTMNLVFSDVGEIVLDVDLEGELAEKTGVTDFTATQQFHTLGDTTDEVVETLLGETFETFASGVIGAVLPGPVMTYRAARALVTGSATGGGAGVELAAFWSGADSLTRNQSLTPQSLVAEGLATGIVGYSTSTEIDVSMPLDKIGLDTGAYGPSFYVSDDPEPVCIESDRRTLTVEGQVTGGPVILMGLDSELTPGSSNHGPPEEHAKMVESILDSVTNDGEGILVLGGNPDSNPDIADYWKGDVGTDPRVDEPVTFVNGSDDILDVDFEGYAMIGIVSSTGQISNGLADSENQALIDRQNDIAEFVNNGGGLLGKTQDGLDDSWDYVSEIADIDPIETGFSSVNVTAAGEELGLTQSGMDGWCCYHESFEEDSIPDFLDVLIRNAQRSDRPPAAVGGDRVVIQTAVELEITTPSVVETGSFTDLEFSLANRSDETGGDVRLEIEITSEDGVSETDVEFASGDDVKEDDGTLVGDLTDEPIEFPPDLDFDLTRELAFNETGSYELAVTVVDDESDEAVVALPFGIKSVDTGEDLEICEG